ncbi:DNA gyrase subunit A, partial [Staphylococcus epidermidis]|uniref:DNA gyrase subunit A n=1 Tax=Staphylococcus epidermidis TaxID=1282 RepID=UPI0037D9A505
MQQPPLPHLPDPLKPLQQPILFPIYSTPNTYHKNFPKTPKTLPHVIPHYHPHPHSSVYDAILPLTQDSNLHHL